MCRHPGQVTRPHARLLPSFLGIDAIIGPDVTTERSFDSQATWVNFDVFGLFFDMLSMCVCTAR